MNALALFQPQQMDPIGSFMAGQQARQQTTQMQNQNALAAYMQQNGAAVLAGDQNALAQIAKYDPMTALQIQGNVADMRYAANSDRRAEASLAIQQQEATLRGQEYRRRLEKEAGAEAAAAAAQEAQRAAAIYEGVYARGPEAFTQMQQQFPDILGDLSFDDLPLAAAEATGVFKPFEAETPASERYRTVGSDLVDITAPGGPRRVYAGTERTQQPPPGYRTNEAGDLEFIPGGPADPATSSRAVQPNETERKAAGYLFRMREAENLLSAEPEKGGIGSNETDRASQIADWVLPENWAYSAQELQVIQARRDWVRAKLRFESGAVIGDDEADQEAKTYFPEPGDPPLVVAQKKAARDNAIRQMEIASGRAAGDALPVAAPTETPPPPPQGMPDLPPEVMDALRQAPPGTIIQGQGGERFIWNGQSLTPAE